MICQICGKEFKSSSGFAYHIKQGHKMSHKYYYDKYLKTDSECKCEKCGSETDFISIIKGYEKLCNNCKNTSNQKMICRICGQETSSLGMPSHLTQKHQMSTKDYYDNYLIEGHCKICGKPTKFCGILIGYNKTCSRKCQYEYQKTDEYLQIMASTNQMKYGKDFVFQTDLIKQGMLKKYGVANPVHIPGMLEKQQETQRKNHDGKLAWNTDKQKETWNKRYGSSISLSELGAEKSKETKSKNQFLDTSLDEEDL